MKINQEANKIKKTKTKSNEIKHMTNKDKTQNKFEYTNKIQI